MMQAGASGSITYGSGGGVSGYVGYSNAKMNLAQVNEQTGIHVGKGGMDVIVLNHTQNNGGILTSEAEKSQNRFSTGTYGESHIENHSELNTRSVSASGGTGGFNPMSTMMSLLGNRNESERSTTYATIGSNIEIDIRDEAGQKARTGKTVEETLQSLNRDVTNANQKVNKQDLQALQERQEATQIVAEMGAKAVGDLAKMMKWEDGSPQKIALHGLIGYLSAKVGGGNIAASTLSAMGSEYINTEIANYLQQNTALTAEQRNAIQQASAAGLGALIGASLGGDSNTVNQSAQMALRTEKFNRQLHPDEKQRIKDLANGDKEKEARLTAAACALVHCSAQIPSDDPEYAKAKALEDLGNSSEFANERALLSKQVGTIGDDAFAAGTLKPMFNYNSVYRAKDYDDANLQVLTRVGGAAQSVGGVAATAFGAGLCETGIGCMGGVPLAAYGVDNAVAGAKTIYSGKYHSTIGATALADLTGISREMAELIYSTPSMAFGAKPIAMGATKATGAVANEVVRIGGDIKYVAGELGKDVRAIGGYLNDESAKFGVNVQNSHALTNINNIIPKEYKIAFGINAITGGAVESLYYLDGSKNITKDNLAGSTIKVGTNAVYDSLVHKLNPAYGVAADTVKSIVIDNKSITNSINGSLQSSGVSSFIEGGADRLNAPPNMGRFISSFGNKYIEYKEESESKKESK